MEINYANNLTNTINNKNNCKHIFRIVNFKNITIKSKIYSLEVCYDDDPTLTIMSVTSLLHLKLFNCALQICHSQDCVWSNLHILTLIDHTSVMIIYETIRDIYRDPWGLQLSFKSTSNVSSINDFNLTYSHIWTNILVTKY